MSYGEYLKDFVTLAVIVTLLIIGATIALKSGAVAVGSDRCRLVLGNVSHLVISVSACVLFLIMIQQLVGMRVHFP